MKPILIVALLVTGCGFFERHPEQPGKEPVELLREEYVARLVALEAASDPATGWPSSEDCDGTLWAGLACAAGAQVTVTLAEHAPGVVHRRPRSSGACWTPEGGDAGARSTVSQDMLTGYLWCLWRNGDYPATRRLADAGGAREERVAGQLVGWVLGEPYPAEAFAVVLRPNLIGVTGRMLYALSGGADRPDYMGFPAFYPPVAEDYEQHLQVLGILLQGEVDTAARGAGLVDVDGEMLKRLHELADAHPEDALFQAARATYTGDYKVPTELLLRKDYAPPSYVRGADTYPLVHWLFAASLVLRRNGGI